MSTTIDERVVSMTFDNREFQKNVSVTIETLEKLKQSSQLNGSNKGLEELARQSEVAANKVGFHWSDVGHKISSVFEYQVADRITNCLWKIVDAGKNMVKELTIDPVKMGLSEYETQLNSVQTILANTESKGSTLEDVNAALDELNTYADKTIYNFTEMTRNIGTFTAAGVELDTSVSAIKGIANLAAVSGSTSQQASTAMYQLSQALASGTVKLMDWNSVVNAGMGGEVFQNALKETARVHDIAIDEMIESEGSFRETLQEGWLTSEILLETLSKFTGDLNEEQLKSMGYTEQQIAEIIKLGQTANDAATKVKTYTQLIDTLKEAAQSGWAQTWRLIIGDFEEAKGLWTGVSNVFSNMIGVSAEVRNSLLSGALDSGWDKLMSDGIMDESSYSFHVKEALKESGVAIDEMIAKEGSLEAALRKGFKEGTISSEVLSSSLGKLSDAYGRCSDEQLKNMGYTEEQVVALRKLNKQVQNGHISMEEYAKKIARLSGRELLFNMKFDDKGILILNEETGALVNIFAALGKVLKTIKVAWTEIFPPKTSEQLYNMLEGFRAFTQRMIMSDKTADKLKRTFKGLFAVLDIAWTVIKFLTKTLFRVIGCFKDLGGGILSVTANLGDFLVALRNVIKGSGKFEDVSNGIVSVVQRIVDAFKNLFGILRQKMDLTGLSGFVDFLKKLWQVVKSIFTPIINLFKSLGQALFDSINGSGVETILDLLNAGILTAIFLKIKDILGSVNSIKDGFIDLLGGLTDALEGLTLRLKVSSLKAIAVAIAILAASLLVLSLIDKDKLESALAAIVFLFTGLTLALRAISIKELPKTIVKGSLVVALAGAILLLSFALAKLAKIDAGAALKGLGVMSLALVALTGILYLLSFITGTSSKSVGIDGLGRMSKTKFTNETGVKQVTKLVLTLYLLAGALKLLGSLSWGEIARGLTAMTVALGVLTGTLFALSKITMSSTKSKGVPFKGGAKSLSTNMKGAAQLFKLILVLVALAGALKLLGSLSWGEIGKGLLAMTVGLSALVAAMYVLSKITNEKEKGPNIKVVIGKSAQFALLASALLTVALALKVLASMNWTELGRGLAGAVGVFAILTGIVAILNMKHFDKGDSIVKQTKSIRTLAWSLVVVTIPLMILGNMKWKKLRNGLAAMGGALLALAAAFAIMSKFSKTVDSGKAMTKNAGAIIVMALALNMLIPVMVILGQLKLKTIAKGLLAIAGIFAVFALATKWIGPFTGNLFAFAGAIALLGAACLAGGAGIYLMALALASLTESVGDAIKNLCEAIIVSADSIGKAMAALLVGLIKGIAEVTGELVKSLLEVMLNALRSMVEYVPEIADAFMELLVAVFDKMIDYVPAILQSFGKLMNKIFEGIVSAMKQLDIDMMLKALTAVGILSALVFVLKYVGKSVPKAMIGLAAIGAMMAELILILALLGDMTGNYGKSIDKVKPIIDKLVQILPKFVLISAALAILAPAFMMIKVFASYIITGIGIIGLVVLEIAALFAVLGKITGNWGDSIDKFAEILTKIGKAIGGFVGGIIGGIAKGITDSLPAMADNMSLFMTKLQPFIVGIKSIDATTLQNAETLVNVLLKLTATSLLNQLTSWLSGGTHMVKFALELAAFGQGIRQFASATSGIDQNKLAAATASGKGLAEMAATIPVSGGIWQMLAGSHNMTKFAIEVAAFGYAIKSFADNIDGCSFNGVAGAANAGKTLAEMAASIPITGGIWGMLRGDGDLGTFSLQLPLFAVGLAGFINKINGITFDEARITAAANTGKVLAEMASKIPVTGGLWSLVAGDNSLTGFSLQLPLFAAGLVGFIKTIDAISFDYGKITTAANTGKILADMASKIPVTGGLWSIVSGDQDIEGFIVNLPKFGAGIAGFIDAITGRTFNTAQVTAAAESGKTLAQMASKLPTQGGLWSKIAGNTMDLGSFGKQVASFGSAIVGFSNSLAGKTFNAEQISAAGEAGISLAKMASELPTQGGLWSKITGQADLGTFSKQIVTFADAIVGFSDKFENKSFNKDKISNATKAGKEIAELANSLDTSGGWFKTSAAEEMSNFKTVITTFGEAMVAFGTKIAMNNAFNDDGKTKLKSALDVADSIVKIMNKIDGMDCDTGKSSSFKTVAGDIGTALYSFVTNVGAFSYYTQIPFSDIKKLGDWIFDLANDIGKKGIPDLGSIPNQFKNLGLAIRGFVSQVNLIDDVETAKQSVQQVTELITEMKKALNKGISEISNSVESGSNTLNNAVKVLINGANETAFKLSSGFIIPGQEIIKQLVNGINIGSKTITNAITSIVQGMINTINNKDVYNSFYSAGQNAAEGFAAGINSKAASAASAAAAMAAASKRAIEETLNIQSPSKELYKDGEYTVAGYENAILDGTDRIYDASANMGESAIEGMKNAIYKISSMIENDIDAQPTIRPVLDLDDVKAGMNELNGMFGMTPALGLSTAGSISRTFSKNQNGGNDDVISAINDLKSAIGQTSGNNYYIGDIAYEDGSAVQSAMEQLIRAIKVEGRM